MERQGPPAAYGEERFVALALANSLVRGGATPVERLATVDELRRWLARNDLPASAVSGALLGELHGLRADIRALLSHVSREAQPPAAALSRVNAIAAEPVTPKLEPDGRVRWVQSRPNPAASIARDAILLAASDEGTRLRMCAAPDCDRLFLPHHGRQVWCSARCGGRVRARRHAVRTRDGTDGRPSCPRASVKTNGKHRSREGGLAMTSHIDWSAVSAANVLDALGEFDRLGAEAFFQRFGFAPTTTYDLLVDGTTYPPKGILGAAYELATGNRLASADFEGGKSGAVKVLTALGFTVEPRHSA